LTSGCSNNFVISSELILIWLFAENAKNISAFPVRCIPKNENKMSIFAITKVPSVMTGEYFYPSMVILK